MEFETEVLAIEQALPFQFHNDSLDDDCGYEYEDLNEAAFRSKEEISTVPFHQMRSYECAGSEHTIDEILSALFQPCCDPVKVEELISALSSCIIHQGTLSEAASATVPFLASIAAYDDSPHARLEFLRLLITMALSSRVGNVPQVRRNISRATMPILSVSKFNVMEPSVQNVHLCFLIVSAPPSRESEKAWAMSVLSKYSLRGHPMFQQLIKYAVLSIQHRFIQDFPGLEDLETEVLDRAEDWDNQGDERNRLLALCGRSFSSSTRLPVDVLRKVKQFLYSAVSV